MSPHGGSFILITTLHSSATVVQTTAIVFSQCLQGFCGISSFRLKSVSKVCPEVASYFIRRSSNPGRQLDKIEISILNSSPEGVHARGNWSSRQD